MTKTANTTKTTVNETMAKTAIKFLQDEEIQTIKEELTAIGVGELEENKLSDIPSDVLLQSPIFKSIYDEICKKEDKINEVHLPEIAKSTIHNKERNERKKANDFFKGFNSGTIGVDERYQRNFVWGKKEMVGLIETILIDMPIQEVYLKENDYTDADDNSSDMEYLIVDGQQRLTTIVKYMNDEFKLSKTGLTYPESSYFNKKYSELSKELKKKIRNYKLSCRVLPDSVSDDEVSKIFLRLNATAKQLNKAELRHAKYFGFVDQLVRSIAVDEFWTNYNLFKKNAILRKSNEEFIAKLFIISNDERQGIKDPDINAFYNKFDDDNASATKCAKALFWAMEKSKPFLDREDAVKVFTEKMAYLLSLFHVLYSIRKKNTTPKSPELLDEFIELMNNTSEIEPEETEEIIKARESETKEETTYRLKQNEIRRFKNAKTESWEHRLMRFNILKQYVK